MKRVIFILSLLLFTINSQAQRVELTPPLNMSGVLKADYKGVEKGTPVTLTQILSIKKSSSYNGVQFVTSINNEQVVLPVKVASKVLELNPADKEEFWINEYFTHEMYKHYHKKGYRPSLRKEVMGEADQYLSELDHILYKDAYIRDYIRTIFTGIVPQHLDKRRIERLNIEIIQSPNPDAYMLANGTLLVSTGLLSTLDSAEELIAIIASETAHYVLDHQVINVGKERARVRRAEIWGVVLAVAATGAEAIITQNSDHYYPGGILVTAGIAGEIINAAAIERLGMGYSDKQYFEADDIAIRFLELNGIPALALNSALYKIKSYYTIEKDNYALSKAGGYGNIDQRMARLGEIKDLSRNSFRKKMARVTTTNAIIELNSKNYAAAERLAKKNIKDGVASDEDYLVFVKSNMNYTSSAIDNEKNLQIIRKAKEISPNENLGLYKQEILLLLRLNRKTEATEILKAYMKMLTEFKQGSLSDNDLTWANEELNWASSLYQQTRTN